MAGPARLALLAALVAISSPAAAAPATYQYTGNYFDSAGAACPECRISGNLTLASALAPNLPTTDLSAAVTSFSFTDVTAGTPPGRGTGLLTNANATIVFRVATDGTGQIAGWDLEVRASSSPAWLQAIGPTGNPADVAAAAASGAGYDGAASQPGLWAAAAPIPALGAPGRLALGALLLALVLARAGRPRRARLP